MLPDTDKIDIKKSNTGDIALRDINKNRSYNFSSDGTSQMSILCKRFKEEQKSNIQLSSFIDDLNYLNTQKEDEKVLGLENKLRAGKREYIIEFALEVKEWFHRKLYKYQFSESAQLINLHLLGLVISYFQNEIYPLIVADEDIQIINSMITERIIKPILNELDENILNYSAQDINGMIYFLTGNCHIKWAK